MRSTSSRSTAAPRVSDRRVGVRRCEAKDIDAISALTIQAFGIAADHADWTRAGWLVENRGDVLGALLAERTHQFFGGNPVPAATLGSVVVAPHVRGRGVGARLVSHVCRALRDDGIALACLYPTVVAFYRSLGFEVAGTRTTYEVDASTVAAAGSAAVEPWDADALPAIRACYEARARRSNGFLARVDHHWHTLLRTASSYRYLVRKAGAVTGYLVYTRVPEQHGEFFSACGMDFHWIDVGAATSLLALLRTHRPLLNTVTWPGPVADPTTLLFDQWDVRRSDYLWMLRVLHPSKALECRGYPPAVEVALDLEVVDASFGQDHHLTVEVQNGVAATTSRAHPAPIVTDVATFAAVFSGWLTPHDAARLGRLVVRDARDLAALESMFGGSTPWLPDRF